MVAVSFFGKRSVGTFLTREQAEWRAKEPKDWSERSPRGYVQYLVCPVQKPRGERRGIF